MLSRLHSLTQTNRGYFHLPCMPYSYFRVIINYFQSVWWKHENMEIEYMSVDLCVISHILLGELRDLSLVISCHLSVVYSVVWYIELFILVIKWGFDWEPRQNLRCYTSNIPIKYNINSCWLHVFSKNSHLKLWVFWVLFYYD